MDLQSFLPGGLSAVINIYQHGFKCCIVDFKFASLEVRNDSVITWYLYSRVKQLLDNYFL